MSQDVNHPVAKAAAAWVGAGISWNEIAAILASIYSVMLIGEWIWKKYKAWRDTQ